MGFAVIQIGDTVGCAQWCVEMASLCKCFARITTLVGANMGMVLQVQRQAFLKLGRKGLTNLTVIPSFEAGKET